MPGRLIFYWKILILDAFDGDACAKLHNIVSNYRLVVKEQTYLGGALLDHAYLHKLFPTKNMIAV